MKMEQTECSETSVYKIQTPGNYPDENTQHDNSCFQTHSLEVDNRNIYQNTDYSSNQSVQNAKKICHQSLPPQTKLSKCNQLQQKRSRAVSDFRMPLLGCCVAEAGSWLPAFRDKISLPTWRVKQSSWAEWPLNILLWNGRNQLQTYAEQHSRWARTAGVQLISKTLCLKYTSDMSCVNIM
jgi:hypothetical protein